MKLQHPFDDEIHAEVLQILDIVFVQLNPSDRVIDPIILKWIRDFCADGTTTGVIPQPDWSPLARTWNYCKYILDMMVHTSGADSICIAFFDLEARFIPPIGGYDRVTIAQAPWRKAYV